MLNYEKYEKIIKEEEEKDRNDAELARMKYKQQFSNQNMQKQQQNSETYPAKETLSIEQKNAKKFAAVEATREHGKILYDSRDYNQALAVYERGILIINGMYKLSDIEYDNMEEIEAKLHSNSALCYLKLNDPIKAISSCKISLGLKPSKKTLYFYSQAFCLMGEFELAIEKINEAINFDNTNDEYLYKQKVKYIQLLNSQKEKVQSNEKKFSLQFSKAYK